MLNALQPSEQGVMMPNFFEIVLFGFFHGAIAGFIWAKVSNDCDTNTQLKVENAGN